MDKQGNKGFAGAGVVGIDMGESIRVVELRSEHQGPLVALHGRHFGAWSAERLAKRWEWHYGAGNPWRVLRPESGLVVFDGERVVGGAALFRVPCRVEGERVIFLCAGDFLIDGPYRPSVIPQFMRYIMSKPHVMASSVHPALQKWGRRMGVIPLPMSHGRFALPLRNDGRLCRSVRRRLPAAVRRFATPATIGRLLGSKPVESVRRWLAPRGGPPLGRSLPTATPAADIRPIERFGDDYNGLWEQARRRFRMTLDKDASYLNWRYVDCPTFRHPILRGLYRDGKLAGVAVAGAYTVLDDDRKPCGADGEVLELITADATEREIEALLLSVCRELDTRLVDSIGALSLDATVREALARIGFETEEDKRFETMVLLDPPYPKTSCLTSTEGVYLTAGDGDILTASLI